MSEEESTLNLQVRHGPLMHTWLAYPKTSCSFWSRFWQQCFQMPGVNDHVGSRPVMVFWEF